MSQLSSVSDFRQTRLPISCAFCGAGMEVTVQQIIDEVILDCSGCGKKMTLRDEHSSFKNAAEEMEEIEKSRLN